MRKQFNFTNFTRSFFCCCMKDKRGNCRNFWRLKQRQKKTVRNSSSWFTRLSSFHSTCRALTINNSSNHLQSAVTFCCCCFFFEIEYQFLCRCEKIICIMLIASSIFVYLWIFVILIHNFIISHRFFGIWTLIFVQYLWYSLAFHIE